MWRFEASSDRGTLRVRFILSRGCFIALCSGPVFRGAREKEKYEQATNRWGVEARIATAIDAGTGEKAALLSKQKSAALHPCKAEVEKARVPRLRCKSASKTHGGCDARSEREWTSSRPENKQPCVFLRFPFPFGSERGGMMTKTRQRTQHRRMGEPC